MIIAKSKEKLTKASAGESIIILGLGTLVLWLNLGSFIFGLIAAVFIAGFYALVRYVRFKSQDIDKIELEDRLVISFKNKAQPTTISIDSIKKIWFRKTSMFIWTDASAKGLLINFEGFSSREISLLKETLKAHPMLKDAKINSSNWLK